MRETLVFVGVALLLHGFHAEAVRDVEIPSFDGLGLAATYYDPGKPGPGVVLFRNCDQRRASMDNFSRKLAARGVNVIVYDYRSGVAAGRSWRDTRNGDADRVHTWLESQPNVSRDRMAAVGGSCGVSMALDFASRHADQVTGIVILSGPSDSTQRAFIKRTPGVAVLGAASVGEGASVGYIDAVVRASTNRSSRLVVLEGASHGTEILNEKSEFEVTALEWLSAHLGVSRQDRGR